jgi:hypothetical protein
MVVYWRKTESHMLTNMWLTQSFALPYIFPFKAVLLDFETKPKPGSVWYNSQTSSLRSYLEWGTDLAELIDFNLTAKLSAKVRNPFLVRMYETDWEQIALWRLFSFDNRWWGIYNMSSFFQHDMINGAWSNADIALLSAVRFSCSCCRPERVPPVALPNRTILSFYLVLIIKSFALLHVQTLSFTTGH